MSEALRRKIDSNSGMPPSVLGMRSFWQQLEVQLGVWALGAFEEDARASITERKVVSSQVARDILEAEISYAFPSDFAPGLCAIVMSRDCVLNYAAHRLNEKPESFSDVSQLFLKLVCEEPAIRLRETLVTKILGNTVDDDMQPSDDLSAITGGLVAPNRYLKIGFDIPLHAQTVTAYLFFHLDYLVELARQFFVKAALEKEETCARSHDTLRQSVRSSVLSVEAVIDRVTLSVGECSRLHVGQLIPLPSAEFGALSIATETIDGSLDIASAEMGVWKTHRAIKMTEPVSSSFVRNLSCL